MEKVLNLEWNDASITRFVTNVGLVTSDGPNGPNVMAAEWTHNVSWAPGLIMINVRDWDATTANIRATGEFGVSIASEDQNIFTSIAGKYSGKEVDKIGLLRDMGAEIYSGRKIRAPMIGGSVMSAECKVVREEMVGDHVMFVGEIVELSSDSGKKPLLYSQNKYWKLGEGVHKPAPEKIEEMFKVAEKYRKV